MKYSEATHRPVLDWRQRLQAVKLGDLNEIDQLEGYAGDWPTCACGQQDEHIERRDGTPVDGTIYNLGVNFYTHVKGMRYCSLLNEGIVFEQRRRLALATLGGIEARASELLASPHLP